MIASKSGGRKRSTRKVGLGLPSLAPCADLKSLGSLASSLARKEFDFSGGGLNLVMFCAVAQTSRLFCLLFYYKEVLASLGFTFCFFSSGSLISHCPTRPRLWATAMLHRW